MEWPERATHPLPCGISIIKKEWFVYGLGFSAFRFCAVFMAARITQKSGISAE
jgi:hypothetical protein